MAGRLIRNRLLTSRRTEPDIRKIDYRICHFYSFLFFIGIAWYISGVGTVSKSTVLELKGYESSGRVQVSPVVTSKWSQRIPPCANTLNPASRTALQKAISSLTSPLGSV